MAFRRFYETETPKAQGMPFTTQAVSALVNTIAQQRSQQARAKQNAQAQYKNDTYESKYASDQDEFTMAGQLVTNRAFNDLSKTGVIQPATRMEQQAWEGRVAESKAQYELRNELEKKINSVEFQIGGKNYYKNKHDYDHLIEANNGEDVSWRNRTDKLNDVAKTIGSNLYESFDKEGFLSDYVEQKKTEIRETKSKSTSGIEQTNKVDAIFLDKNGVPGVGDDDAIEYLQSSDYVTGYYQQALNRQLLSEAKQIQSTLKGQWLNGLSDAEAVAELRNDPTKNTVNQVPPGIRERNLAKIDLEKKQRQNLTNSYDAGQYDPDAAKGITSKYFTVGSSFNRNPNGGSGGQITSKTGDKTGMTISIRGQAYDKNVERLTGNDRSSRDAVVKSFNLAPVLGGVPVNIQANDAEEYIQKINEIPLDQIDKMQLKTIIHAQAFNRPEVLSMARIERDKLSVKPNKTEAEKNTEETLTRTLEMSEQNPDLAPEVIQSALRMVLGTVVEDLVKVVEPKDPETIDIQNKLGRYNITDPKNWSSDDKAIAAAFEARKKEANAQAYKVAKQAVADPNLPAKRRVTSDDEYKKLPPGSVFIAPDGKQYKKPGGKLDD